MRRGESEGMLDLFGGKKRGPQVSSVLDEPPTARELKSHSKKYFQSWLRRREWLLRKVNRLEYVDRTTLKCTLSYDVDLLTVQGHLEDHPIGSRSEPIPHAVAAGFHG